MLPLPSRYLLNLQSNCNLHCPQCLVHGREENFKIKSYKNKIMPLDKAMLIADEICGTNPLLIPSLWSEPLLYPYFKEIILYMKKKGITLNINTNGILLTEDMSKFLVESEYDSVIVSVDAVTDKTLKKIRGFSRLSILINNIERLVKIRGEKIKPRIGVSMTVQDANKNEQKMFVKYWGHKVDFIRIGTYFDGTHFSNDKDNDLIARIPCPSLYSTMAIHADGNVSMCCLDIFNEYNLGNIFLDGVMEVWKGDSFLKIRKFHEENDYSQLPLCQNCSRWRSYQYSDRIEDGFLIRESNEYIYYNSITQLDNWGNELLGTHTEWKDFMQKNV